MPSEVLTLAEAATYLRVSVEDVLRMHRDQALPGRKIGEQWRFLKGAIRDWLGGVAKPCSKEALLEMAGKFKDDPFLEKIVDDAYRRRGRPMTEDGA